MTRYQVFFPPKDLEQLGIEDPLTYQTISFTLPENLKNDRQAAVPRAEVDVGPSLGSPFSSLNSLHPTTRITDLTQDVTFDYAGAVDFGPHTQSQSQSPKRSGQSVQAVTKPTGGDLESQGSSFDTTTSSTLPPSNTNHSASLGHFPQYRVPLNRLTALARLMVPAPDTVRGPVTLLVCVVQVDEAKAFRTDDDKRHHRDGTGKVGSWSVVMAPTPDSGEFGSQITFWGRSAEDACQGQVRRGDVVLLENASYTPTPKPAVSMSDRAQPPPSFRILYRTLPRYETTTIDDYRYKGTRLGFQLPDVELPATSREMLAADRALRPDMRLGRSDVAIRKIGELAQWFAAWVGGEAPVLQ